MKSNVKKGLKKCISALTTVLIIVLVAFVAYLMYCQITGNIAFIGQTAYLKIVSPSMEPTIPTGSYIKVEKINDEDISNLKENDIIVFYSRDPSIYGKLNTHRVIKVETGDNGTEFVTKGDNNSVKDALKTSEKDVVGIYKNNMPTLTSIANVLTNKTVFLLLVMVPAVLLIIICIINIIKKSKSLKVDMLVEQRIEELKKENQLKEELNEKIKSDDDDKGK